MTDKVKIRRHLVAPLCFSCPNFAHELVKGVGWVAWCRDKKQDIRTNIDPTPKETCPGFQEALLKRRGPETPEQRAEAEKWRLFDKRRDEAEKIVKSGKIDLDKIKNRVVRQLVLEGLEKLHREEEERARIEGEEKRIKEWERQSRG